MGCNNSIAAASVNTAKAPVLLRPRNFQWYWNSTADAWSSTSEEWTKFSDVENEILDDALKSGETEVEIDGGYIVDLKHNVQYRYEDSSKQSLIKRVDLETDRGNVHLREERFSLPIAVASTFAATEGNVHLSWNLANTYYKKKLLFTPQSVSFVVEQAANGIWLTGRALGRQHEANWMAERLLEVKQYGAKIKADYFNGVPARIGQTCIYLYSKESFLYKHLNKIMRDATSSIPVEELNALGPFCWLLAIYVTRKATREHLTVYRGLNLTDEQREEFIKLDAEQRIRFLSFTSTSRNRAFAEQFGNTLLVIEIRTANETALDISANSAIPEEEEVLITTGRYFRLVKHGYDDATKKYIIHLEHDRFNLSPLNYI